MWVWCCISHGIVDMQCECHRIRLDRPYRNIMYWLVRCPLCANVINITLLRTWNRIATANAEVCCQQYKARSERYSASNSNGKRDEKTLDVSMFSLTFIMTNWFSRCLQSVFGQVFIQIWVQHDSVPNSNSIQTAHGTILVSEVTRRVLSRFFSLFVPACARSETKVCLFRVLLCVFFRSTKCPERY